MNKILYLFFLLFISSCSNLQKQEGGRTSFTGDLSVRFLHREPLINRSELTAHWPLDEGSGYRCRDWSGNGLTAYMMSHSWNREGSGLTSSFRRRGKRAGCIYLDGKQWLQVQHHPKLNWTSRFTLSIWVKPVELASSLIFCKARGNKGFYLSLREDGSLKARNGGVGGQQVNLETAPSFLKAGIWQQIGVLYDHAEGIFSFLRNGEVVETHQFRLNKPIGVSSDLFIGGSSAPGKDFKGFIDEVTIFHQVLSEEALQEHYLCGLPRIYGQTKETIDAHRNQWNHYHGNVPVPHPNDEVSVMNLRFNRTSHSLQQHRILDKDKNIRYVPGNFGAALDAKNMQRGLKYVSPYSGHHGTFEAWVRLDTAGQPTPVFMARGGPSHLELELSDQEVLLFIDNKKGKGDSIQ